MAYQWNDASSDSLDAARGQPVRIISIGCPIPSPSVDNHSVANAPSIFDYDACIIDPQSVSDQIEAIAAATLIAKAPDGRAISTSESGAFHFGLSELLEQRRLELQQLLDNGGLLIVFAYPNVRHASITSFPGLHRYSLIPSPDGDPFRWPTLRPADGKDVRPTIPQHAASGYLDDLAGRIRYRAILDIKPSHDTVVTGRSVGGAAIAAEFRVGPGRLLVLPPPDNLAATQRKIFSSALLECVERLLQGPDAGDAPVWVRHYDTADAAAARDAVIAAQDELKQAQRQLQEAESLLADATRFQAMLWYSQNAAFREVIEDAFRMLGYAVTSSNDAMEMRDGSGTVFVEIASSDHAVSDRTYLTLQQRIEESYLRRKSRPKGIIVANGFRQTDPRIRRAPFPRTLVNACETYRYALIPSEALIELVTFASEAVDEPKALEEIRRSIANTAGVLEIASDDEAEDKGPEPAPVGTDNGTAARAIE